MIDKNLYLKKFAEALDGFNPPNPPNTASNRFKRWLNDKAEKFFFLPKDYDPAEHVKDPIPVDKYNEDPFFGVLVNGKPMAYDKDNVYELPLRKPLSSQLGLENDKDIDKYLNIIEKRRKSNSVVKGYDAGHLSKYNPNAYINFTENGKSLSLQGKHIQNYYFDKADGVKGKTVLRRKSEYRDPNKKVVNRSFALPLPGFGYSRDAFVNSDPDISHREEVGHALDNAYNNNAITYGIDKDIDPKIKGYDPNIQNFSKADLEANLSAFSPKGIVNDMFSSEKNSVANGMLDRLNAGYDKRPEENTVMVSNLARAMRREHGKGMPYKNEKEDVGKYFKLPKHDFQSATDKYFQNSGDQSIKDKLNGEYYRQQQLSPEDREKAIQNFADRMWLMANKNKSTRRNMV